ncbi:uncharacterized protein LOC130049620 [Ostrea edulis]|uniref:uncharacterized protein LOC130049620 n=1 Tax=Ostrea edulis TaxID=37623 RepID=UPI0024AEF4BD|nr:uncharacterized protein LOC130049620 [Ostrea edulis]
MYIAGSSNCSTKLLIKILTAVNVNVNGELHKSTGHAFQLTKAIRNGDISAADRIRSASNALEAKRIGDVVKTNSSWETEKVEVMTTIIEAKFKQVKSFRDTVQKLDPNTTVVEATQDDFWGSGLDEAATLNTRPKAWPGLNKLGKIIKTVAKKQLKKPRSNSVPTQPARKSSRNKQQEITTFVSQLKDGNNKRSRDNLTTDDGDYRSDMDSD